MPNNGSTENRQGSHASDVPDRDFRKTQRNRNDTGTDKYEKLFVVHEFKSQSGCSVQPVIQGQTQTEIWKVMGDDNVKIR